GSPADRPVQRTHPHVTGARRRDGFRADFRLAGCHIPQRLRSLGHGLVLVWVAVDLGWTWVGLGLDLGRTCVGLAAHPLAISWSSIGPARKTPPGLGCSMVRSPRSRRRP